MALIPNYVHFRRRDLLPCIEQRREQLLSLPLSWSNLLVSKSRFDSQTTEAITLAAELSGGAPEIALFWLNPMTIEAPDVAPEEVSLNIDQLLVQTEGNIEADQAVFVHYLTAEPPRSGGDDVPEDTDEDVALALSVKLVWEIPQVQYGPLRMCIALILPLLECEY